MGKNQIPRPGFWAFSRKLCYKTSGVYVRGRDCRNKYRIIVIGVIAATDIHKIQNISVQNSIYCIILERQKYGEINSGDSSRMLLNFLKLLY